MCKRSIGVFLVLGWLCGCGSSPAADAGATKAPDPAAVAGSPDVTVWEGTVGERDDRLPVRLKLAGPSERPLGSLEFGDPETAAWYLPSGLMGTRRGGRLELLADSGLLVDVEVRGRDLAGTIRFPKDTDPTQLTATVALTRVGGP